MQAGTEKANLTPPNKGAFSHRQDVLRNVAAKMMQPADDIQLLANKFSAQLHEIDSGFRTIINGVAAEIAENIDDHSEASKFFDVVRTLSATIITGFESTDDMASELGKLEGTSRDLRPVLRRVRRALVAMTESRVMVKEWTNLIDEAETECASARANKQGRSDSESEQEGD